MELWLDGWSPIKKEGFIHLCNGKATYYCFYLVDGIQSGRMTLFSLFYCHFITLWLLLRLLRNAEALAPRLLCLAWRVKDVLLKRTHTEQNWKKK